MFSAVLAVAVVAGFDYNLSGGKIAETGVSVSGSGLVASDGEILNFSTNSEIGENTYSGGVLTLSGGFTASLDTTTVVDLGNDYFRVVASGFHNEEGIGGLSILYHNGTVDSGNVAFSSVPEPPSAALIGIGVVGALAASRQFV